jgi:hypothetical protein
MNNPIQQVMLDNEKMFDEKLTKYDKDGGFIVYVEDETCDDFDTDLIQQYLHLSQLNLIKAVVEMVKELDEEKARVLPPENEGYMFSLAQFNRVAGVNQVVSSILSTLTPLSTGDSKEK